MQSQEIPMDALQLADVVYTLLEKNGMQLYKYTNEELFTLCESFTNEELSKLREACNAVIAKIEEVAPKNKSILFFCTIRSNIAIIVMDRFVL